ncbi:MAG TPA: hypothetical protein VMU04_06460, partial [Candidatus Acidoferrum sp.]|nr:hypothetical protein [Candidatus Acidoferrum sp.]
MSKRKRQIRTAGSAAPAVPLAEAPRSADIPIRDVAPPGGADGNARSPAHPGLIVPPGLMALLLFAVTLALYLPAAHYDYINCDDPAYVVSNPHVLGGLTWSGVKWAFAAPHVGNWIPISWMTHMLDVQLFGKGAGGPHLVNALIHALNAALVFWLLRRMTGSLWRSA